MTDETVHFVESIFGGVKGTNGAPGIVLTTPAPVEVEVVVHIVAVANKGVTASAVVIGTTIIQRHVLVETTVFQHLDPLFNGIEIKSPIAQGLILLCSKAKIVLQRRWYITGIGSATIVTIHHFHGNAAVMQELGNIEYFLFCTG